MSDRRVVFIPPNVYCNDYSVAKLTLGAKLQLMSGHEVREQLDAKYVQVEKGFLSQKLGNDWKFAWVPSVPIMISAPTGAGKNFFVGNVLLVEILKFNRKSKYKKMSVLILSNRVALNVQNKLNYVKIIDENSGCEAKKYAEEFANLPDEEQSKFWHFGQVDIMSYQQIWFRLRTRQNFESYDFVIFDECHYFAQDAVFNPHTDQLLAKLIANTQSAYRIYLSATIEEVVQQILELECRNRIQKRPIEFDRPFALYTHEVQEIPEKNPFPMPYDTLHRNEVKYFLDREMTKEYRPAWGYSAIIYDMERDYSYLQIHQLKTGKGKKTTDRYGELIEKIKNSDAKWLIFVDGKDAGEALARFLNDSDIDTAFVCSESKNNKRGNGATLRHIVQYSNFEEKVLVTTSVLDNGVNIHDPAVKNIVLFTLDRVAFLQMLGRVRRPNDPAWRLNLYLPEYTVTQLQQLLKRDFSELLQRLEFDLMKDFERLLLLEQKLSGSGLGVESLLEKSNTRFNENAKIKLSNSVMRYKNFMRFFNPTFEIELCAEKKAQKFYDIKNAYDDDMEQRELIRNFIARQVQRVLPLNVEPRGEAVRLPEVLLYETNPAVIEEKIFEVIEKSVEAIDDKIDFLNYIYIERFKFATEKIFELTAKRQEILYKNDCNDCANVQEIEKKLAFWKSKQEKFSSR